MDHIYLALITSLSLLSACGAEDKVAQDGYDDYEVEIAPGESTSFRLTLDGPHQFELLSDSRLKARIKATTSDATTYESEWHGTPYVDVHESGEVTVEIYNDSSEPLTGDLLAIPR